MSDAILGWVVQYNTKDGWGHLNTTKGNFPDVYKTQMDAEEAAYNEALEQYSEGDITVRRLKTGSQLVIDHRTDFHIRPTAGVEQ